MVFQKKIERNSINLIYQMHGKKWGACYETLKS